MAIVQDYSLFGVPICCRKKSKYGENDIVPGTVVPEFDEDLDGKKDFNH